MWAARAPDSAATGRGAVRVVPDARRPAAHRRSQRGLLTALPAQRASRAERLTKSLLTEAFARLVGRRTVTTNARGAPSGSTLPAARSAILASASARPGHPRAVRHALGERASGVQDSALVCSG